MIEGEGDGVGTGDALLIASKRSLTREYEAKMSLMNPAIRVGRSKFCAVTEFIDNRGCRSISTD